MYRNLKRVFLFDKAYDKYNRRTKMNLGWVQLRLLYVCWEVSKKYPAITSVICMKYIKCMKAGAPTISNCANFLRQLCDEYGFLERLPQSSPRKMYYALNARGTNVLKEIERLARITEADDWIND